jgi:3-dehydroquinate synthase
VGQYLSRQLKREFVDTDAVVEEMGGKPIESIFEQDGEAAFRQMEAEVCRRVAEPAERIIACGGGALLSMSNRALLEAGGYLVCLTAEPEALMKRIGTNGRRPLLNGDNLDQQLKVLLAERREAYASIPVQVDTTKLSTEQVAERIADYPLAKRIHHFTAHRPRPGYGVMAGHRLLSRLATYLEEAELSPPYVLISDTNVALLYEGEIRSQLDCSTVVIPAGEENKSQEMLSTLYSAFIESGLDRSGTVIALGGGVLLDLAGFAAATFMRGLNWAALPTSLLAIVDASLGGKVGINLPVGKNLVGAFHAPRIVLADFSTLATLPKEEVKTGLAEMIKAALIGDADLFARMEFGPAWISREWIQRSIEVKLKIVDDDPRETGKRAALNLGHTFAHAFEVTSGYSLTHGQAVSVGMVAAARLAAVLGRCAPDLPDRVEQVLRRFDLPVTYKGLRTDQALGAMVTDKKSKAGRARFVLPKSPGQVEFGIEVPEELVHETLKGLK